VLLASRGGGFHRLPGSGEEVEKLATLLGSASGDRLVGLDATEPAVKRLSSDGTLARYRYLHFACHGVLGASRGERPGLVLAQVNDSANTDGYLRIDEVTDLRLNADLVVLSACQSGQGTVYRAEGVSGLARAFLYAGTRGVLCSLWPVEDEATADLMVEVYQGLKNGKPAAEALRAAQLAMIAENRPPNQWAPFVLIGR
jgi:CHAT domain-containing protein